MPAVSAPPPKGEAVRGPRGPLALTVLAMLAVVAFAGFVALGTWQVQRRAWKLDLIARVDQRVHAPAVAAPAPDQWTQVTAKTDEYRHVRLTGVFLHDRQTLVSASTSLGSGYWVMTPLRMADGVVVLVNRGFVLPDWCGRTARCAVGPSGVTTVAGLLRMTETKPFLRRNDPAQNRWYARDIQAIAGARGLTRVAPYFVDADAALADETAWPRAGLTVISFPNNHLVYLVTWYLLALMVAVAAGYVGRHEYRLRRLARNASVAVRPPHAHR
ncbi:SURF1 family protein [Dyella subtropica]|uniref:SURF1 family protein n=1 Tax=Dyella subtropica TaxID=2992127 RepID=UPI00225A8483|nr:SURF1 family protein [Dyella subtropica]